MTRAGTPVPGRLIWRECRVVAARPETDSARTLALDVPDWPGHMAGQRFEVRGPLGRDFVWDPDDPVPVALAAGGSGIIPLMAVIRTRARLARRVPFRLLYATRGPADVIYGRELERHSAPRTGLDLTYAYSRRVPPGWPRQPGRVDQAMVAAALWPPEFEPVCYVCGPGGFVERVADLLVAEGHSPARIKKFDGAFADAVVEVDGY